MNETVNNLYPQLHLLEFRWDHGQQLVIPFSPGLVILHGKTQTHRTMVLRLIRYAMGGSAGRIDENVMRASEEVELKFTANGELIRVVRSCQRPTGRTTRTSTGLHEQEDLHRSKERTSLKARPCPRVEGSDQRAMPC